MTTKKKTKKKAESAKEIIVIPMIGAIEVAKKGK